MLTAEEAKRIIHRPGISRNDAVLVLLAMYPVKPLSVAEIRERCSIAGLPKLAKANISDVLSRARKQAARVPTGWELQQEGLLRVRVLAQEAQVNLVVTHSSRSLRGHAEELTDQTSKSFVMEAITCFEAHQYRAAIVFSWAGAIAILHRLVFETRLNDFNTEALRRNSKWQRAKQQDDLGRMKEVEFLDLCESLGIIGKNVKQLLQNECLVLRNACSHPNSVKIAENSAAAHIEKLIKNIFATFPHRP